MSLFSRTARVTCWRENIPADSTKFVVTRKPNAIAITDLRIEFRIRRSLARNPDQADITITNLAPDTRHNLETKPLLVQLEAGYAPEPRLIFTGDLRFAMTELDESNWHTLLQLGDGDCHHRYSRVSRSYAPGTTRRTILRETARSMGLDLPSHLDSDTELDEQMVGGDAAYGPARETITRHFREVGANWTIQHGKLVVLRDSQVSTEIAYPIDVEHGMIGSPRFGSPPTSGKPPHVHVSSLLYPELMPGVLVEVKSKVINGRFRVENVEHTGDTHGTGDDSWSTKVEISPHG